MPRDFYAMLLDNVPARLHNYIPYTPGISETTLPFFFMTMYFSGEDLSLHKGEGATHHRTLNGINGIKAFPQIK
jgi:hypothetical protein